jgi:hypothetical protein
MHSLAVAVLVKIAHLGSSGQSYPQQRFDAAVSSGADADVADIDIGQQAGERRSLNPRADRIVCRLAAPITSVQQPPRDISL